MLFSKLYEKDLVKLQGLDFLQEPIVSDNIFFLAILAVKYYNGVVYYYQNKMTICKGGYNLGNYNFEDKSKEFGETVRIDTINEEVRKREESNPSKEYIEDENYEYKGRKASGKDIEEEFQGRSIVSLSIIGGAVVFVFIFFVMFLSNSGRLNGIKADTTKTNDTDISQGLTENDGKYAIVLNEDYNRTVRFYSINDKKHLSLTVDSETILTGANGGGMDYSDLKIGDVVVVTERNNTGNAAKIFVPQDIWKKENITEVKVDTSANTVEYNDKIYNYGDDTFFVVNGNSVYPGDISETDTVTLIGKNNMLFVTRIEKTHGHLVFKNLDKVDNAIVKVDGEVLEADKKSGMIEISEGEHEIVVSGTNIEDYETTLLIIPNDKMVIDINEDKITKKLETGIIKLKVSPSGYNVVLDGVPYLQSTTEIYAEKGDHKIEIVKPGYETYTSNVAVADTTAEVNIKLEKLKEPEKKVEVSQGDLSVYSNPGWAKVYIDGEYIGVSPVMVKLPYGEHYVRAELEGYDEFKTHVTVDSPDKAVTAEFE